jgi:hypothetical protein
VLEEVLQHCWEDLDPAEAADVLRALAGPGVFLKFVEGRGWTLQRYVAWTTDALSSLLLHSRTR